MEMQQQKMQGVLPNENLRYKILESIRVNKLMVAQAKIDSLTVDPNRIEESVNERINRFIAILGSEQAGERELNKSISKIKEIMRNQVEDMLLTEQVKYKIVGNIEVTPSDAAQFYKQIPRDSVPIIPKQYVYQQICIYPPSSKANFKVKERLLGLRKRIINGEKFSKLAILYSEEAESAKRGGELGLSPASSFLASFRNASLALKPGQISQIVETEYGFHLIQMIEKQGDLINVRHILLKPTYSSNEIKSVLNRLDSIKSFIEKDSIKFETAVLKWSQDVKTRMNSGLVSNMRNYPPTSRFKKDELIPADFSIIKGLKEGDLSEPFKSRDDKEREVYKIIRLKEIIPSHTANMNDDFDEIKKMVLNRKQQEKFGQWLIKKQAATYIKIDPDYRNCIFESKGWLK